jgi:hypothetical protein
MVLYEDLRIEVNGAFLASGIVPNLEPNGSTSR